VSSFKSLGEIKAMAGLVATMLKSHSDTEDALFLGPLEHCFEQIGQRDSFLEEHEEMNGTLHLVQSATRIREARRLLLAAIAHSRRHFDREERIVFPLAERVLKHATLEELGQAWMDQRARGAVRDKAPATGSPLFRFSVESGVPPPEVGARKSARDLNALVRGPPGRRRGSRISKVQKAQKCYRCPDCAIGTLFTFFIQSFEPAGFIESSRAVEPHAWRYPRTDPKFI